MQRKGLVSTLFWPYKGLGFRVVKGRVLGPTRCSQMTWNVRTSCDAAWPRGRPRRNRTCFTRVIRELRSRNTGEITGILVKI